MSRLLLALVLLAPAGCLVDKPTTAAAAKKVLTRDEFKRLVIGKTADEVKALLGPPMSTNDAPSGGPVWKYRRVTIDPANDKTDDYTFVYFGKDDGLAFKILN